jgi:PAS domain S-box-containing protein
MQKHQPVEEELGIYEAIIASSDDAIVSKTLEGIITSWNPAAERLFGYNAQEAIGRHITLIIPVERHPEEVEILAKLRAGQHIEHFETVRQCKDGRRIEVSLSISPVKDRTGKVIGAAKIARDLSERRQAERARLHLAALVESADTSIIGKTSEGFITSWNLAAQRLYGYSAQEAVGQPITLIFPVERQQESAAIMHRIRQGERVELYETIRQRKDGSLVPVSVVVSPIYDQAGQLIGASDIAHDITERKRAETEQHLLEHLSHLLASTLDAQVMLTKVGDLLVEQWADWWSLDLVDAAGQITQKHVMHRDPELLRPVLLLRERLLLAPSAPLGVPHVVRSRKAELHSEISDEILIAGSSSQEGLEEVRQVRPRSAMVVPLLARDRTTGVISLVRTTSDKPYDMRDLALAQEVGRRVGLALEHARLYRDVQQGREQLAIILQGVADGIIVSTLEQDFLYANEVAAQMCEVSNAAELQTCSEEILHRIFLPMDEQEDGTSEWELPHRRVLVGEPEAQIILRARDKDQWVQIIARPVLAPDGTVSMAVSILHDITERMQVERRKDMFISMTSHELKTPVTSLKGFSYVLKRHLSKREDTQALSYLARMDVQFERLSRLINDLLDISRMQSGKLMLRVEPVDLDALIDETVETVQATTTTHHLAVQGQTGVKVMGDPERLGQVFINLLTNAIKYSPQAERVVVHRGLEAEKQQVEVRVQDFGIGIDPVHHQKIFERFYQVTDPEEKTYPGLGVGLYITSEIVTRHRGQMWVESRKGQGATFVVTLPRLEASLSATQPGENERGEGFDARKDG